MAQKIDAPGAKIQKSLAEAKRISRNAKWVMEYDVEELLALPLAEARTRLNLITPAVYNSVPDEVKQNLLKPKNKPQAITAGSNAAA